jgi:hypothetical protein
MLTGMWRFRLDGEVWDERPDGAPPNKEGTYSAPDNIPSQIVMLVNFLAEGNKNAARCGNLTARLFDRKLAKQFA